MNLNQRRAQAEAWAAEQAGFADWDSEPVSSDASFRSYYRLVAQGDSLVVMDAPPEHEPVTAFLDIAQRLRSAGLHAPEIKSADPDLGFVLLEDLGRQPYHHVLNADNADDLFTDALKALRIMQTQVDSTGLPVYDPARLLQELALFPDWFLSHHWQVEPSEDELDAWDHLCALLIRWAQDQPQVFCHRDFMPRNLMQTEPNPGIIDFQDALIGPISYDPVCLFRDAFLSWPQSRVDAWLEGYRIAGRDSGLPLPESPDLWRRTCDFMGVQRHLKVIGIFARICYRDGKPAYLQDVPRFFSYLDQAIARNPELAPLEQLLTAWRSRKSLYQ
jgi:aminoglycoside/choline kinase family phosphotransferase